MKKKQLVPILAVAVLIIVVMLISIGSRIIQKYIPSKEIQDMKEYYGLVEENDMAIVLDDKVLDVNCKYLDGEVYVDFDTVHEFLNERFYWDANENVLLYTTSDSLITVEAGSYDYTIAKDKNTESYVIVRNDSNTMYVALDFVEKYTNMTHEVIEDPNRVLITSVWGDVDTTSVKNDTQLRLKGGIKSPILKELVKGEAITVIEQDDTWTKVATTDGIIGYMKTKFMGTVEKTTRSHEFEEPVFTHISKEGTIEMAWHQVTSQDGNGTISSVLQSTKGINVISPTWFYLNDNDGNVVSIASKTYVDYCHENNIEVWALVSNLENQEVDTTMVLSYTSKRQNLVNQLIAAAIEYNLDGINVDMEALSSDAGEGYLQFIRELSLKCANNGIVLSVDNYVPSDYTAFYNRAEQANFADYIIIMAYDEHYVGSDEGSVASLPFEIQGIEDTLKEVPAEQTIVACPFYTRIWQETPKDDIGDDIEATSEDYVSYTLSSEAVGMDAAQNRISMNGAQQVWSEEDGQYYAEYVVDGLTYKIWVEDATSIEKKLEVMKSNNLAGVSFWKLGFETSSIWDTIIKYTN